MPDVRRFVQFIHPGGEHSLDRRGQRPWNLTRRGHRRKFLRCDGAYVLGNRFTRGPLEFWGEWEPQSDLIERVVNPVPNGPHFVFRPYWSEPADGYTGLQNTDPFVFGERICYMGCQQRDRRGPTRMSGLGVGSVVLFGSQLSKTERVFVLDTVLVVAGWTEHTAQDFRGLAVDPTYMAVTFKPWYENHPGTSVRWRLYFGATHKEQIGKMYSFFPCRPSSECKRGFARPIIELDGYVNPDLEQRTRAPEVSQKKAFELWSSVCKQVKDQGLTLGLSADMPPKR